MDGRRLAAERGLAPRAVAALTAKALGALPFEALAPTKALLKRFFSPGDWDDAASEALAGAVEGLAPPALARPDGELTLEFGWVDGRFRLGVDGPGEATTGAAAEVAEAPEADALAASFEGDVVPEATPNPRTVAFRTGPVSGGHSREYRSAADADDPRVARLFAAFPEVSSVLVASDFVAVSVRRPERWPALLAPVLAAVEGEFATGGAGPDPDAPAAPGMAALHHAAASGGRRGGRPRTRLDRAWDELGTLRATEPGGLERLLAASEGTDPALRQVAAGLLGDAPPPAAHRAWTRLAGDPSRAVRRAAVDAAAGVGRDELRPLLEGALGDADAWVRWKALRGLAQLGAGPSAGAVRPLWDDPDFRVRLEARSALRR
ncbi:MAG TPA: HEAT repeat domain-containing protein [Acidimicrobiales bacterium]|nr:HEAT repeat domain-containing protein [Acidimicrobiales bacterium]